MGDEEDRADEAQAEEDEGELVRKHFKDTDSVLQSQSSWMVTKMAPRGCEFKIRTMYQNVLSAVDKKDEGRFGCWVVEDGMVNVYWNIV